jgi:hypothetical protein
MITNQRKRQRQRDGEMRRSYRAMRKSYGSDELDGNEKLHSERVNVSIWSV